MTLQLSETDRRTIARGVPQDLLLRTKRDNPLLYKFLYMGAYHPRGNNPYQIPPYGAPGWLTNSFANYMYRISLDNWDENKVQELEGIPNFRDNAALDAYLSSRGFNIRHGHVVNVDQANTILLLANGYRKPQFKMEDYIVYGLKLIQAIVELREAEFKGNRDHTYTSSREGLLQYLNRSPSLIPSSEHTFSRLPIDLVQYISSGLSPTTTAALRTVAQSYREIAPSEVTITDTMTRDEVRALYSKGARLVKTLTIYRTSGLEAVSDDLDKFTNLETLNLMVQNPDDRYMLMIRQLPIKNLRVERIKPNQLAMIGPRVQSLDIEVILNNTEEANAFQGMDNISKLTLRLNGDIRTRHVTLAGVYHRKTEQAIPIILAHLKNLRDLTLFNHSGESKFRELTGANLDSLTIKEDSTQFSGHITTFDLDIGTRHLNLIGVNEFYFLHPQTQTHIVSLTMDSVRKPNLPATKFLNLRKLSIRNVRWSNNNPKIVLPDTVEEVYLENSNVYNVFVGRYTKFTAIRTGVYFNIPDTVTDLTVDGDQIPFARRKEPFLNLTIKNTRILHPIPIGVEVYLENVPEIREFFYDNLLTSPFLRHLTVKNTSLSKEQIDRLRTKPGLVLIT